MAVERLFVVAWLRSCLPESALLLVCAQGHLAGTGHLVGALCNIRWCSLQIVVAFLRFPGQFQTAASAMETAPMKHILTLSTALACLSMWLTAQAPQQSAPPGPSPQQRMMGYFAGDWTLTGTMKISPNTPAAAFTGSEHGEWVPGSFFLETHSK